jgi:uncharacterized membrane protein
MTHEHSPPRTRIQRLLSLIIVRVLLGALFGALYGYAFGIAWGGLVGSVAAVLLSRKWYGPPPRA